MNRIFTTLPLLLLISLSFSQTISFTDQELKRFLITENCIDTNDDGYVDSTADFNADNEIQTSEATSILNLHLVDFSKNYSIKSIQDISQFGNLTYLKVISNDSITEISNLGLDNLTTLWISSAASLKAVDISDLVGLTDDFRLEGIDTLDYLNIQNGSVTDYFSLFYSEHIHYACVDSIAKEYDEVVWRMISGLPTLDCETAINENSGIEESFLLYPNPTSGLLTINTSSRIGKIQVFNVMGGLVAEMQASGGQVDISGLDRGVYFIGIWVGDEVFYRKVVKV